MVGHRSSGRKKTAARVAASKRQLLLGFRHFVAFCIADWALISFGGVNVAIQLPLIIAALVAYLGWDQHNAVWVESARGRVVIRRRTVWKLRDLGEVTETYPTGTTVRYDASSVLWRIDRSLYVGSDRYAVLPEGREEAERLAHEVAIANLAGPGAPWPS